MTKEIKLGNELRFTRLAAHIIGDNLDKSPIEIGNMIVRKLHSQGCVLKVDGELPDTDYFLGDSCIWAADAYRKMMEEAGYVKTESLIKEG